MFLLTLLAVNYDYTDTTYTTSQLVYEGTYTYQNSLFIKLTDSAITFGDGVTDTTNLVFTYVTFADINAQEGSGFSIWNKDVNTELDHVCFTNCSTSTKGGAFLIQNDNNNNHHINSSLSFVSLSKCSSYERVIYICGDHEQVLPVTFCNF